MPTDESIVDILQADDITDDDLFVVVQNVSTTPVTRGKVATKLKSFLKTYFDTLYAALQMTENNMLLLDASLSADGTYSGIGVAGTAGAALAFGNLAYYSVTDSRWELTDADAAASMGPVRIGMCVLAAAADGDPTLILLWGKIRADSLFPTMTVGAPLYGGTTAGAIQVVAPSGSADIVRIIGYGITADELDFRPDNTFIELT